MSKDSHISTRLRGIRARIPGRLFTDPGDNPFLFLVTMFPAAENIISEEGGYRSVDACYLVQGRIPTLLLEPPVSPKCLPCLQGDPLAVGSTVCMLSRVVCACVRPRAVCVGILLRDVGCHGCCLLYTSPSPRDGLLSRMPSSA